MNNRKKGETKQDRPVWAGRVQREKIALLYKKDGQGIVDEDLIEDVGIAFLARIAGIMKVGEALSGRAHCPYCEAVIHHQLDHHEILRCETCNWELSWGEYHKSFRGKQLAASGIKQFCSAFVEDYSRARSPQEKMILIDTLIHRYHWELEGGLSRSGAINLIGGKPAELVDFLNTLTYGEKSNPEILATREAWIQKVKKSRQQMKTKNAARRQKTEEKGKRDLLKQKYREQMLAQRKK